MCENVISEAKTIYLAAYGLMYDEIIIKEVDGKLTIKTAQKGVNPNGYLVATINTSYTLKNTTLKSSSLSKGVLTLEFEDTPNVTYHKVTNAN